MTTLTERIQTLVKQYAQTLPARLEPGLSLRRDLSIDSLSLVSLTLRLGDELGVDIIDAGVELGRLDTVGDLVALAETLDRGGTDGHATAPDEGRSDQSTREPAAARRG